MKSKISRTEEQLEYLDHGQDTPLSFSEFSSLYRKVNKTISDERLRVESNRSHSHYETYCLYINAIYSNKSTPNLVYSPGYTRRKLLKFIVPKEIKNILKMVSELDKEWNDLILIDGPDTINEKISFSVVLYNKIANEVYLELRFFNSKLDYDHSNKTESMIVHSFPNVKNKNITVELHTPLCLRDDPINELWYRYWGTDNDFVRSTVGSHLRSSSVIGNLICNDSYTRDDVIDETTAVHTGIKDYLKNLLYLKRETYSDDSKEVVNIFSYKSIKDNSSKVYPLYKITKDYLHIENFISAVTDKCYSLLFTKQKLFSIAFSQTKPSFDSPEFLVLFLNNRMELLQIYFKVSTDAPFSKLRENTNVKINIFFFKDKTVEESTRWIRNSDIKILAPGDSLSKLINRDSNYGCLSNRVLHTSVHKGRDDVEFINNKLFIDVSKFDPMKNKSFTKNLVTAIMNHMLNEFRDRLDTFTNHIDELSSTYNVKGTIHSNHYIENIEYNLYNSYYNDMYCKILSHIADNDLLEKKN